MSIDVNIVKHYCLLYMYKIHFFPPTKINLTFVNLLLSFHIWPLQLSFVEISGLDRFMIELIEYVNCWKTEIFEQSRACTEFAFLQHQRILARMGE